MHNLQVGSFSREFIEQKNLFENCDNIFAYDEKGRNLLHHAAFYGKLETCKLLVEKGLPSDGLTKVPQNFEPYQSSKWLEIIKKEGMKETPLFFAVKGNRPQVVSWLLSLSNHCTVNLQNSLGITPLFIALEKGYHEIVDILIAKGADINQLLLYQDGYYSLLHMFCHDRNIKSIEKLLNFNPQIDIRNSFEETPLHSCALVGNEVAAALLIEKQADVNLRNGRGKTPLFLASQNNYPSLVTLLLTHGANPWLCDSFLSTPFSIPFETNKRLPKECCENLKKADDGFSDSLSRLKQIGDDFGIKEIRFTNMTPYDLQLRMESLENELIKKIHENLKNACVLLKQMYESFNKPSILIKNCKEKKPLLIWLNLPLETNYIGITNDLYVVRKNRQIDVYRIKNFENLESVVTSLLNFRLYPKAERGLLKSGSFDNFIKDNYRFVSLFLSSVNQNLGLDLVNSFSENMTSQQTGSFLNSLKMSWIISNPDHLDRGLETYRKWEKEHFVSNIQELNLICQDTRIQKEVDVDLFILKIAESVFSEFRFELLESIFQGNPHLINKEFPKAKEYPLTLAVYANSPKLALSLIQRGADVNRKSTQNQMTPLLAAVLNNLPDLVTILLNNGAIKTPSIIEAVQASKNPQLIDLFR